MFSCCTHGVQVETFGSMKREEKVEFILEQMRLGLAKKDYIRTQIISKKVSTKFFADSDALEVQVCPVTLCGGVEVTKLPLFGPLQQLKLKFYQLMIKLCLNSDSFLDISRHYFAIYQTPCVQEDSDKKKEVCFSQCVVHVHGPFRLEQVLSVFTSSTHVHFIVVVSYRVC